MTARTFLVGGGIVIAVAALYLDQRGLRAEVTALHGAAAPAGSERARRPDLAWRPAPAPREATAGRAPAHVARIAEPEAVPRVRPTPTETPVEQFAHVHDALERTFGSEPSDGAWAMEARRAVESKLADLPVASRIRSIDCRSTLCRVETVHDGPADAQALALRFSSPAQRPWNGGFYAGPTDEDARSGAVTVVTYLVREGTPLPELPDRDDDAEPRP